MCGNSYVSAAFSTHYARRLTLLTKSCVVRERVVLRLSPQCLHVWIFNITVARHKEQDRVLHLVLSYASLTFPWHVREVKTDEQ